MFKNWENETKNVRISEMSENSSKVEKRLLIEIESPPNGRQTKICEIRTPRRSRNTVELTLTSN